MTKLKKQVEFYARIITWAGALSVEAVNFLRITQEHSSLALVITLCLVGLATFITFCFDFAGKLRDLRIFSK